MSSSNVTTSSAIQNEIDTINSFIISYARYVYPIIFLFGIICNILNIYVFTQSTLKRNPCCMYFLASSFAALIYTAVNLPLRTLQMGYNIDPTVTVLVVCKLKNFFVYTWRALAVWFLTLACIDRFLHSSSNVNFRGWSSYKVASRVIPLTFLLAHLAYLHVAVFYEILLPRRTCSILSSSYAMFLGIWHLLTYGTGAPLLMLFFSLLTIQHIRHRQIVPVNSQINEAIRKSNKDRSLVRMALFQCLIVGLTTTAYAAFQWYSTLTSNQVKSNLQLTKDNLAANIVGSISAAGHSTTFFIFTLTSRMFRKQLLCHHRQEIF
ncbi:unnamed protein product [Adineta steineri]|uniref:G-protein coupled receptors family 1 profile domain-containing protein n=1 Tax=Adineta steineri TaxID=433720 RepID=A0A814QT91_9BILA|nr:unnamed protein product [Adineta steineri]CAF1124180.1 unnamed protein product [Adineta steineri]